MNSRIYYRVEALIVEVFKDIEDVKVFNDLIL